MLCSALDSRGITDRRAPHQSADEDGGDFSDFYIPPDPSMSPDESRRLQEEQDAELARLMQDQESKVRGTQLPVYYLFVVYSLPSINGHCGNKGVR